ncbi:hypothetical protein AAU61_02190 [Desulfocarbo indianensis]|nr:hypothetical protein AAU61_02190 [Desulfocarbo indianensis]
MLAVTGFFLFNALKIPVKTYFPDLLPQNHPFIKLIKGHPKFGGTNTVIIGMEVLKGDIFDEKILQTLIDFSNELYFLPSVDRTKVVSLGVNKIRNAKITSAGISSPSILYPNAPATDAEMDQLKADVYSNPAYYGNLVSLDAKVALITLGFFEDKLQPRLVYSALQNLKAKYESDNIRFHIVGEPYLYGVIFSYLPQTLLLFLITVVAMLTIAFLYTRSLRLTLVPLFSAAICAVWGLGFMQLMGYTLDPLVLVVPLLISATALSHSIQFNWRISEAYAQTKDLKESCYQTVRALFYPGLAGVITDATGILLIALIPIPLMEKLGISIFVWCLSMVFGILIFNPVINLYLPPMKKAGRWREARRQGFMEKKLLPSVFTLCSSRKRSWTIVACFLALALITFHLNSNLIIGDIEEGSPILKPDSVYNQDVEFMAQRLPGSMNPMLVIVEGEDDAVKEPELLEAVDRFQAHMAKLPEVTMTLSIVNLVKGINMAFYENNPNYFLLPDNRKAIYSNLHLLTSGGAEPGDYDTYYSHDFNNLSITIYCVNHLPSTIAKLLNHANEFIVKNKLKIAEIKLAGGRIGVIAANNESIVVELATTLTAALVLTGLFVMIVFRSFMAGLILVVPLSLASWFTFGYMAIAGIAINLQSLPVSIIAIGIGVDYGVYLLSRMREEHRNLGDLSHAVRESINTAGNAIILTGIIVIAGVVFWVFSDIMFQAEMGILFSIVTLFHVLGALVLLPAMIQILRPRFLFR